MTINILLADDHDVLRRMLRAELCEQPDFRVVGEARDGQEALRLAHQLRPDVLVADVHMPAPDGIALTRMLAKSLPGVRVLILTLYDDAAILAEAMAAGAAGYLPKRHADLQLIIAVRVVANGGVYYPPNLRSAHYSGPRRDSPQSPPTLDTNEPNLPRGLPGGLRQGRDHKPVGAKPASRR